ncbi:unnamed protein product [Closterium sp. NIES-54]
MNMQCTWLTVDGWVGRRRKEQKKDTRASVVRIPGGATWFSSGANYAAFEHLGMMQVMPLLIADSMAKSKPAEKEKRQLEVAAFVAYASFYKVLVGMTKHTDDTLDDVRAMAVIGRSRGTRASDASNGVMNMQCTWLTVDGWVGRRRKEQKKDTRASVVRIPGGATWFSSGANYAAFEHRGMMQVMPLLIADSMAKSKPAEKEKRQLEVAAFVAYASFYKVLVGMTKHTDDTLDDVRAMAVM